MQVKIINKIPASAVRKKRVCAYARVSTDSRRQEDSLENQTAAYERLIKGNPEYEFAGVYANQGISVAVLPKGSDNTLAMPTLETVMQFWMRFFSEDFMQTSLKRYLAISRSCRKSFGGMKEHLTRSNL